MDQRLLVVEEVPIGEAVEADALADRRVEGGVAVEWLVERRQAQDDGGDEARAGGDGGALQADAPAIHCFNRCRVGRTPSTTAA